MGYMRYHTIVVADHGHGDDLETAHKYAEREFPWVSPISPEAVNGVRAFFIPPDGSKEGWPESNDGDIRRKNFLSFLESFRYGDQSARLS